MGSESLQPGKRPIVRPILIVGAGFSGAVLARQLAENGFRSVVIDERDHIAGNCHSSRDTTTGVMVHQYGPHIFNANSDEVWLFVNRFADMRLFTNRVKAHTSRGVFSLPINLHTINHFFDKRFTPSEARTFIESLGDKTIGEPANFEEQALKFLGRELYDAFFYGYTKKQWGCEPAELPASILRRLPIRFSYDDSYYTKKYQAIPKDGYTTLVENVLRHDNITVELRCSFEQSMREDFLHVVYTGPIDRFFEFSEGRLGYRTVYWQREEGPGDLQGNAVINYPGMDVPHTRKHEHKHFAPWEQHDRSVLFTEHSKETDLRDIPYYPKRLAHDKALLSQYVTLAKSQSSVSFLGRLATYRYMDMDVVIEESLHFSRRLMTSLATNQSPPIFPIDESVLV